MAYSEKQITDAINQGANASYASQQAIIDQQRDDTIANLQSQYDDAVANGEISVRDAENQFKKQSEEINKQHYLNTQATAISAQDMGLANSMQFQGLQRGDLARRDTAVNGAMSERDIKINDIKTRLKQLEQQKNRDITMANNQHGYALAGAKGQSDMQKAQQLSEFYQQNYFMDKEQANQLAMTQLGFAHDEKMQNAGFAHDKEMSNQEFQQQIQMRMKEAEIEKQQTLDEYDLAVKRELAKYTPGTREYDIRAGQLNDERTALLSELSTKTQFDVISKDILNGQTSKPKKPSKPKKDWFETEGHYKKDLEKYNKEMKEYNQKLESYNRYLEYQKDPMSAFTNSGGLGSLSAKYESSGNPGAVAHTKGDKGGASYGTYQFSTTSGSAKNFAKSYGGALAGLTPGTKAFDNAWKAEAKKNPAKFEKAQHDYIAKNFYKPGLASIKKRTGVDLSGYPKAIQDVIWSVSVQHGQAGAGAVFKAAGIKKGDSPATIINKVYNVRKNFFKGSSKSIQNSVAKRFERERQDALRMLG